MKKDIPEADKTGFNADKKAFDVLIVDDDADICLLAGSLLKKEGFNALIAQTKDEALALMAEHMPDGVIIDIMLPDGTGYELTEQLRAMPAGDHPAVLIISSLTGFLDKVEAVRCGADGYFEKPIFWDGMMRRMQFLLESKSPQRSRVLIVADNSPPSVESVLSAAGYQVYLCHEVNRIEASLQEYHPDLIIVETLRSGITAYDLKRLLHQDERYATLPVLLLIDPEEAATQQVASVGGNGILIKPLDPQLLLFTVAAHIEKAHLLNNLLMRDGLTRLLTHAAFEERAHAVLAEYQRNSDQLFAFIMIDLDHFKAVNDRFGHLVGDNVLISLAALLRQRLRSSDIIGRYGGEEFAIIIESLEEREVLRLVKRLLEEFSTIKHMSVDGSVFNVQFSAGIAMLEPGMTLDSWKQAADNALYEAKRAGRNCVRIHTSSVVKPARVLRREAT